MRHIHIGLLALLAVLLAWGSPAGAAQIGVTSVAKNDVSGSLNGRTRVLRVGTSVFQNEVISTGAQSSTQLLFQDETSLTVGANSQIKLDRFVYNPSTKSGDVVVSIAKGAFRFITGSGDPRGYKIKTPAAVIGIRGTIVEGYQAADGSLVLVVIEGGIDVTTPAGLTISLEAGEFIAISPAGVITGPRDWTGPTLDLDAGIRFVFDNRGNLLEPEGDGLPTRQELNDALDSKNIEITIPPEKRIPPPGDNPCPNGCILNEN